MTGQASYALMLYHRLLNAERRARKVEEQLNEVVALIPKEEMAEYIRATQEMDEQYAEVEDAKVRQAWRIWERMESR